MLVALAAGGALYVVVERGTGSATPPPTALPRRAPALPDLTVGTPPIAAGVTGVLRRTLRATGLGRSLTGEVVDAATGAPLFSRQPTLAVPPASTAKLLTAAAALTVLNPGDTLTTGVVRRASTLYLVGGGDVTLTATARPGYPPTATLSNLATRTVAALGSRTRIRLRYDDGGWVGPTLAKGWSASYVTSGNVSRLSALELDEARLAPGPTAPRASDPAAQTAGAFRKALARRGITVVGPTRRTAAPAGALGIAAVQSASIAALVQRMLTASDNDLAEALGRIIALRSGRPATFTGAAGAVAAAVARLGVPMRGVRLYDASGLSRLDRVTASTLVTLLRIAQRDEDTFGPLLAGLPVAGFTGTLAQRYRDGPARAGAGVVHAKTGTLAGVNALAGQVLDADGRVLVFAFVADHVPLPAPAERGLDRLAAALARCGCAAGGPPT